MKRSLSRPKEDNDDDGPTTLSTSPQVARSLKKQKYSRVATHTTTTSIASMDVDSSENENVNVLDDTQVAADEEDWTKVEKRKAKKVKKAEVRKEVRASTLTFVLLFINF